MWLVSSGALWIQCNSKSNQEAKAESEPPVEKAEDKEELHENLDLLNEGYSMLYDSISGLKYADEIMRVKVEQDHTQKIVEAIADYSGKLKEKLEKLKESYPDIRLDVDPLPKVGQGFSSCLAKEPSKVLYAHDRSERGKF